MLTMLPSHPDLERYHALRQYDIERIEHVDMRPKHVTVRYLFSPNGDGPLFECHKERMFADATEFYRRYGVHLTFEPWLPGQENPRVPEEIYYTGFSTEEFLSIPSNAEYAGFGYADLREILQRPVCSPPVERCAKELGDILIHEIGHALTLTHTDLVPFDCVRERQGDRWNVMGKANIRARGAEPMLHPLQVRQMHSYLSRGQVYEAMGGEDPDWYAFMKKAQTAIGLRHRMEGTCAQKSLCLPCLED